jgi:hypothetical protein
MRTLPSRVVIGLILLGGVAFAPVGADAPAETATANISKVVKARSGYFGG